MITLIVCTFLLLPAHAWILPQHALVPIMPALRMSGGEMPRKAIEDPCWQNMLDDDCSMGSIYASSFVAGQWIKSMPCAEGVEDCDMPEALMSPDTRAGAGVGNVDVMDLLGLKRAASLKSGDRDELAP